MTDPEHTLADQVSMVPLWLIYSPSMAHLWLIYGSLFRSTMAHSLDPLWLIYDTQAAHIANIAYALTQLKRRPDLAQIVAKFITPHTQKKRRRAPAQPPAHAPAPAQAQAYQAWGHGAWGPTHGPHHGLFAATQQSQAIQDPWTTP